MDKLMESKVLACVIRLKDFCASASQFVRPSHFSGPVEHNMYRMASEFYTKYGSVLTEAGFISGIKDLVGKKVITSAEIPAYTDTYKGLSKVDVSDHAFVMEKLTEFVKHGEYRLLIEDAVKKHLPKNEFDEIEKKFQRIAEISATASIEPVAYFDPDSIKARFERREYEKAHGHSGITTGIKKLDDCLPGKGWRRRELYTIIGDSKAGKTQAMLWFANAAAWAGYTVGYWTFETATDVMEDRLDALNTDTEIAKIPAFTATIRDLMLKTACPGQILFFEYPTKTCRPSNIRSDLKRQAIKGQPIELGVFDYADIMRSDRKFDSRWDEQVAVYEDLRALLGRPERGGFDIPGITGMQAGQGATKKQVVEAEDGAGAYEKIAVVDGALTIAANVKEEAGRDGGELSIRLSRFRNAPPATIRIKTNYAKGRFYSEALPDPL